MTPQKTGVYDMTFEVVNFSDQDKTYTLDTTVLGQVAQGGRIVNGEVTYLTFDYARELEVDTTCSAQGGKVTVPANSKVEVHVTVTLPEMPNVPTWRNGSRTDLMVGDLYSC